MATTKTTTPRKRPAAKTAPARTTAKTTTRSSKPSTPSTDSDDSLVARTGRTIKERPYTSAAIATGAVTIAAAAAGATAFLMSRRDKSLKEAGGELGGKVKQGLASASETVRGGIASATETVKDLGQRGSAMLRGEDSEGSGETRTQQQIAEEALTLKQTGETKKPIDELSATEIKTGAVAY